jgi:hypothetical protein
MVDSSRFFPVTQILQTPLKINLQPCDREDVMVQRADQILSWAGRHGSPHLPMFFSGRRDLAIANLE